MKTSTKPPTRSAALAEFTEILHYTPASLESGLTDSVIALLQSGRDVAAVDLYNRFAKVLDSHKIVCEGETRDALAYAHAAYSDHSDYEPDGVIRVVPFHETADGQQIPIFGNPHPKHYRKPVANYLRQTYVTEVCGPTARQQAAREQFAAAASANGKKHGVHANDAARAAAGRARDKIGAASAGYPSTRSWVAAGRP